MQKSSIMCKKKTHNSSKDQSPVGFYDSKTGGFWQTILEERLLGQPNKGASSSFLVGWLSMHENKIYVAYFLFYTEEA